MALITTSVPDITSGVDALATLGPLAATQAPPGAVLVVIDPFLHASGVFDRIRETLDEAGFDAVAFTEIAGEPKASDLRAAHQRAREAHAVMVVGVGGGSALDVAKITAATARAAHDPSVHALGALPLPAETLPKIMIPTTAGTGSETSATNIFSDDDGRKTWIWGPRTKADHVILDPRLTVSLPPQLTAWCGIDAIVHAFEAATNRNTHRGATLFAHAALPLLAGALPRAVRAPDDLAAREAMLLGSCYAGVAIDACGTAVAHLISHALSSLAPVHHGLATALAFEATLPWLVAAETAELDAAARAMGLPDAAALPGVVTALMDQAEIDRALPPAFADISPEALVQEMRRPEHAPMRRATCREVTDADLERFADLLLSTRADHVRPERTTAPS